MEVRSWAPLPEPRGNVIAIGRNYQAHAEESARAAGRMVDPPTVFTKAITSVAGAAMMTGTIGPVAAVVVDVVHPSVRATATAVLSLAQNLFGMKFKVITGYEATPKIHLAMERGEVHGTFANWSTLKAIAGDWIRDRKIRILAQWDLKAHPEMADVPMFLGVAKTEADRAALQLALARLEFGRPFFMPPSVPADRVAAVRRAFDASMTDQEFLAEAERLKIEVDPLTGEEVAGLIAQLYRTPADIVARVRAAMENK